MLIGDFSETRIEITRGLLLFLIHESHPSLRKILGNFSEIYPKFVVGFEIYMIINIENILFLLDYQNCSCAIFLRVLSLVNFH